MFALIFFLLLGRVFSRSSAPLGSSNGTIRHWLYTSKINSETLALLDRPDIAGIQALYKWKSLEPAENQYDFSSINNDLQLVKAKGKQLWVQLQDRTFDIRYNPVPKYLHAPIYNNGSVPMCDDNDCDTNYKHNGWLTAQWNPHVRRRFQALMQEMANQLDGRIYGINLPETAVAVQANNNFNFTVQGYFEAELENAKFAATVFRKSYAVQYVNFWPDGGDDERNYLAESFAFFAEHGVGVGGPDNIPCNKNHREYPLMSEYRNKVPIAVMAVQEPDLKYINPITSERYTKEEFTDFAARHGIKILFWATCSPWLGLGRQQCPLTETKKCPGH
ncbi:hypothetical protein HIM_09177 [Hirsutella minnesotensis 3608]|uniref:Glycoside hydrolase family 42 N-terminal domain-containing protein n=1 Tax=Hirsutella minnesotensis 3608 TaxID=1043627 RepID=A0A0F7ZSJ1_9HYPO|nr:hypothetical protein HIM_09177 [Hirsutella minnesotensis 3608]